MTILFISPVKSTEYEKSLRIKAQPLLDSAPDNDSTERRGLFQKGGLFKKKDQLTEPLARGTNEPVAETPSKKK